MRKLLLVGVFAATLGCGEDRLVKTRPPDVRVDQHNQRAASKVDVLWVVDNSGSMEVRQENLAKNFDSFIDLFSKGSIDYRIAVTTTDIFRDMGQFRGSPKVLDPSTSNIQSAFASRIRVGINGSPFEAGLAAAQMSLERQRKTNEPKLNAITSCQQGCLRRPGVEACLEECVNANPVDFLRPDAFLYLIFVSDEDDESDSDIRFYWRSFETSKGGGNDETVTTAAIIGDVPSNRCGATPGSRYVALSKLTGGEIGSICDDNFSVTLRKLATNAVGLKRKFSLSKKPNVSTLKVSVLYPCNVEESATAACASVDKSECANEPAEATKLICTPVAEGPDGWTYEPATEVIFFAGQSLPGLRSVIQIEYYEEGKGPQ